MMGRKSSVIKNINIAAEENAKAFGIFSNAALARGRPLVKKKTVFFW